MNPRLPLALAFSLAGLLACRSSEPAPVDFACTCGTPEAALEPCLHAACAEGHQNVDNPECACGTLSFGEED